MNLLLSDPAFLSLSSGVGYDPDAAAYIARVEGASGDNQALETAVKDAYNAFFVGCKADGTWNAIKASCILAGARTLNGALQPLVGAAPTNYNFVAGDYNRKTGLVGNGSTKYLNSNRSNNADPQNNQHVTAYRTAIPPSPVVEIFVGSDPVATQGATSVYVDNLGQFVTVSRSSGSAYAHGVFLQTGLTGISRASSAGYTARFNGANSTVQQVSGTPTSTNLFIFDRGPTPPHFPSASRLAFYSIGESLDLALLDARVTTLINAFSTAIP